MAIGWFVGGPVPLLVGLLLGGNLALLIGVVVFVAAGQG
ncbi:hypothetical protein BQ8420_23655 [Nocardiopsis sp. JB363]|nr:hypothetical protein BQ8420_23655 [Nocardiopsis sp. JB363]